MNLFYQRSFASVFLLFLVSGLNAQYSTLDVDKHDKEVRFTTSRGTTSRIDTITMSEGKFGGRYYTYFMGPGNKFFNVVAPAGKWIKMKKYTEVKLLVVFSPPASFKGETNAVLHIDAPSGMRAWIRLVGTSTD